MKINSIHNYSEWNCNTNCRPKPKNINFGFSEDYGPDLFMEPDFNSGHKEPSTINTIKLIIEIPLVLLRDFINERREMHEDLKMYNENQQKVKWDKSTDI